MRFTWFGLPPDLELSIAKLIQARLRIIAPSTLNQKIVSFDAVSQELFAMLARETYAFLAGSFTVDIQLSPNASFVVESSGPMIYFRPPTYSFEGKVIRTPSKTPTGPIRLVAGYVEVASSFYVRSPPGRSPTTEAKAAFKEVVTLLKSDLVVRDKRWVGRSALERVDSGSAQFA